MGSQKVRCDWATSLHFFRTLSQISDGYVFALNTQENTFILNNPKQKSLNKAISKIRALNIYGHLCRQNNYKETLCLVTGPIIKNDNDGVSYQLGDIYPSLTRYATCKVWENESENEVLSRVQLFVTPWMDCSPPGSSLWGIFQARILEWVAISFSRRPSRPRDWTLVSCIAGRRFTLQATREVQSLGRATEIHPLGFMCSLASPGLSDLNSSKCKKHSCL